MMYQIYKKKPLRLKVYYKAYHTYLYQGAMYTHPEVWGLGMLNSFQSEASQSLTP